MTGVMLAQQGDYSQTGGGGVNWTNITGSLSGETNIVTMPYSTTITISVAVTTGFGSVYYSLNEGSPINYSGPFAVTNGDDLQWGAQSKGTYNSTVTVSKTGPTVIDTFTISLT